MLNVLNTIKIFGLEIDWPMETALFWLLIAQVVLVIFMVIVFAILILRVRKGTTQVVVQSDEERKLVGIELDTSLAPREFLVGEEFSCEGLLVTAHFNQDPYSEILHEITVLTPEKLQELMQDNKKIEDLEGCVVYVPKLDEEGKPTVTVAYKGKTAVYAVSVVTERAAAAPVAVAAEEPKERTLESITLDTGVVQREFKVGDVFNCDGLIVTAHYSADPLTEQVLEYTVFAPDLSVEGKPTVTVSFGDKSAVYAVSVSLPAPEKVARELVRINLDTDAVQRKFTAGDRFNYEGLVVYATYSSEPLVEVVTDYAVDKPDLSKAGDATVAVRFGGMRAEYAISIAEGEKPAVRELIGITLNTDSVRKEYTAGDELNCDGLIVTANYNLEPLAEEVTDYEILPIDMTQVGAPTVLVRYGDKTIGFQITVSPAAVVIDEEPEVIRVKRDPIVIEEESFEGGKLRYDRSFTARLIQSDDEVKHWYTELKNELLSYKKVKARMSWKRESFRCGREIAVRLAYRGKTLCIYFPLDPKEYEESKYKVEPVDDSVTYEDTPCLYRIKNAKRVRYAMDLIAVVMERLGVKKDENHVSEDFYVPYEGIVELINKGLIKRNIKTKEDEAFFRQNADAVKEEVAPADVEIAPGVIVTSTVLDEEKRHTLPVPETVSDDTPEEAPVEEAPVEEPVPVEEVVEEPAPVEEVPVEEPAPIEEVVEESAPVEEVPVEEPAPVEEVPVEEPAPVEEVPVEEPAPIEEVVDEPAPVDDTDDGAADDSAADDGAPARMSLSERRRKNRHKRR